MATSQTRRGKPVTLEQLNQKVEDLAAKVESLATTNDYGQWWKSCAGAFKDDQMFDEILKLGRQQRRSDRSQRKSKRASP